MTDSVGLSPRERHRARVRARIKEQAWQQIAAAGVPALSLNAVAKKVGLSGPALYRYFASRDDLITDLITDAYRSLADTVKAASDSGARLAGLAHVIRGWANDDPQRYSLVYATPVPGCQAPAETTAIAAEVMTVLIETSGAAETDKAATAFDAHLEDHRGWAGVTPASPATLHRAISFWTRLHGVISLELAGQFTGMGFEPGLLIDDELSDL